MASANITPTNARSSFMVCMGILPLPHRRVNAAIEPLIRRPFPRRQPHVRDRHAFEGRQTRGLSPNRHVPQCNLLVLGPDHCGGAGALGFGSLARAEAIPFLVET